MADSHASQNTDDVAHVQRLLNSFRRYMGYDLIPRDGTPEEQARRLDEWPAVVVSHGCEADPIINYGNQAALRLWEVDSATLRSMPSRETAEPMHRDERARLLERTARQGYVDDYQGIRISSTGRRFRIERAIVWNVVDEAGQYVGQAATFDRWTYLDADANGPKADA